MNDEIHYQSDVRETHSFGLLWRIVKVAFCVILLSMMFVHSFSSKAKAADLGAANEQTRIEAVNTYRSALILRCGNRNLDWLDPLQNSTALSAFTETLPADLKARFEDDVKPDFQHCGAGVDCPNVAIIVGLYRAKLIPAAARHMCEREKFVCHAQWECEALD